MKGIKLENMDMNDWQDLDELARSTIMLTLSKNVYFNVNKEKTSYELWTKLCDLYEKRSAASQVYWLKKLVDLKMDEGTPMCNHLNEFNTIFSQLSAQGVNFEDSVKAMFLLVTLPESWDTFRTAISNSAPVDGLTCADVEGSLLTEEVNRKNLDPSRGSSNALFVRGRSQEKGKQNERGKSRSKSRGRKELECYYCHKKGHMKKDCRKWKQEKGKDKKQEGGKAKESSVKIEEINSVSIEDSEGDIYFTSILDSAFLVATSDCALQDWVLDSGASFHVTPHREWFSTYDAARKGRVRLGNDFSYDIIGVGDVQLKF